MSIAPREPAEKYCFTYCGDRCDCQLSQTVFGQPLGELREWLKRRAPMEGDCDISAGAPSTSTMKR